MLTTTTSKSLPGVERQRLQRAGHAVQHLRAQHRALVVGEREHDRARAEELAELHVLAVLVAEHQVERQLLPDLLVDPDLAERAGSLARTPSTRSGALAYCACARRGARQERSASSAGWPGSGSLSASRFGAARRGAAAGEAAGVADAGRGRRRCAPEAGDDLSRLPRGNASGRRSIRRRRRRACLPARRRAPGAPAAPASAASPSPCRSARARCRACSSTQP